MRTSVVSACLATSLASAVQAADVNTWKLSFWSGSHCTSEEVAVEEGPAYPSLSQVCNQIPGIGLTQAFDYEVANGDYSYTLGLHKTDDCSDAGGVFQGPSAIKPLVSLNILLTLDRNTRYSRLRAYSWRFHSLQYQDRCCDLEALRLWNLYGSH